MRSMVEGLCPPTSAEDALQYRLDVLHDIARQEAYDTKPAHSEPAITHGIPNRIVAHVVDIPVDLDRQLRRRAVEIEDNPSNRMLFPEL